MKISKLQTFHLDCQDEYLEILKEFNILFYGYGNKKTILKQMFRNALIINTVFYKQNEFIKDLKTKIYRCKHVKNSKELQTKDVFTFFEKLDELLKKENKTLILIILNFNKEFTFLQGLKAVKIIGTIEYILHDLTLDDINDFNFVLKDLTTFEPYEEEIKIIDCHINNKNKEAVLNVLANTSLKSRNMFLMVLKTFKNNELITFDELVKKIGKKYLITKIQKMKEHLNEFFDHEILKKKNENEFLINLSKTEIHDILIKNNI